MIFTFKLCQNPYFIHKCQTITYACWRTSGCIKLHVSSLVLQPFQHYTLTLHNKHPCIWALSCSGLLASVSRMWKGAQRPLISSVCTPYTPEHGPVPTHVPRCLSQDPAQHCNMSRVVYVRTRLSTVTCPALSESGPGSALSHVLPCLSQDHGNAMSHVPPCLSQDLAMHCLMSRLVWVRTWLRHCLMSRLVWVRTWPSTVSCPALSESGPGNALSHVPPCLSQDEAVHSL
jgi:hypothetical protein